MALNIAQLMQLFQQRGVMKPTQLQDDPGIESLPWANKEVPVAGQNSVGMDLQRLSQRSQQGYQRPRVVPGSRVPLPKRDFEPKSQEELTQDRLAYAYEKLGIIDNFDTVPGQFQNRDYLERAEDLMFRANQVRQRAALNAMQNFGGSNYVNMGSGGGFSGGGGKGEFARFVAAISGKESGGNYGAVNRDSGALGKYQIMPGNIAGPGGWDMEALGRNVTPQQFLGSPSLQEKIARYKLKQYYSRHGIRGAASAWYSGDPNKWRNRSPQGGYPSIYDYVMSIVRAVRG